MPNVKGSIEGCCLDCSTPCCGTESTCKAWPCPVCPKLDTCQVGRIGLYPHVFVKNCTPYPFSEDDSEKDNSIIINRKSWISRKRCKHEILIQTSFGSRICQNCGMMQRRDAYAEKWHEVSVFNYFANVHYYGRKNSHGSIDLHHKNGTMDFKHRKLEYELDSVNFWINSYNKDIQEIEVKKKPYEEKRLSILAKLASYSQDKSSEEKQ